MTSAEGAISEEETARLARRFVEVQGIDVGDAMTVAAKIAASDADIWAAALRWLDEGSLPDKPEIEGYTPESLGRRFPPSVALTALKELRLDPKRARSALRHSPQDLRRPPRPG